MYNKETFAEEQFRKTGPFWHLHTPPLENEVFQSNEEDRTVTLNYLAISVMESNCKLLAFSLMSNHFHFILSGSEEHVEVFWDSFRKRLDIYFSRHGRPGLMRKVRATLTPIENLNQLRTEIAYVIRNRFVVQTNVHVFADPCSSGYLYFNPFLQKEGVPASTLKGRELRKFTHSHRMEPVDFRIYVKDGCAQMWSFVDYKLAESFYDHARQFIHSVLKNVEAHVETAKRLGERPFLGDDELWPLVFRYCRENYQVSRPSSLDLQQRKQLAVWIKREYAASNKQIARLSGLSMAEANALFPLSTQQD